jgi:hypothetical protein
MDGTSGHRIGGLSTPRAAELHPKSTQLRHQRTTSRHASSSESILPGIPNDERSLLSAAPSLARPYLCENQGLGLRTGTAASSTPCS